MKQSSVQLSIDFGPDFAVAPTVPATPEAQREPVALTPAHVSPVDRYALLPLASLAVRACAALVANDFFMGALCVAFAFLVMFTAAIIGG